MAERDEDRRYMADLKECIVIRDEKIVALSSEMSRRDETIKDLKSKLEISENKVTRLAQRVEELTTELHNRNSPEFHEPSKSINKITTKLNKTKIPAKKTVYKPLSLEETFCAESFFRFFVVSLPQLARRSLCPFDIENSLIQTLGERPKSLSSSGEADLLVEVVNKAQSEKLENMISLCNVQYTVKKSEFFGIMKGLIYIYDTEVENFESFKNGLVERYQLENFEEARWIKTRNPNTRVFVLSSYSEKLPDYVRIISEPTLTRIFPYRDLPLRCKKCLKYSHTTKRCNSDVRCSRCSGEHSLENCTETEVKCLNCSEKHEAGSLQWPVRMKEQEILDLQKRLKIGRAEARRIVEGDSASLDEISPTPMDQYFEIQADATQLRKICPFKIEKFLIKKLNVKRENISIDRKNYIIKCENQFEMNKIQCLKPICDTFLAKRVPTNIIMDRKA